MNFVAMSRNMDKILDNIEKGYTGRNIYILSDSQGP
jgi:hypothetical protein